MTTATVHIDGREYQVDATENMLHACLSLGLDLPYFCWHPAMGSVGACRQCAVKQFRGADDTHGKIVMACMTPAAEGTRISIEDNDARELRASVIEWLMINHPHDCPVCDEGGECHLQDMTVMTGHDYRRYRFTKRTYRNQDLGPFINHEMNRCIQCYRCVRFYRDYAGGRDFDVFGCHDDVYFGRHTDGTLESEFSGNLIEVCPTGVFDDKTLMHHYTRVWDLQTSPSVCVHCAVGCNTIPGERYGELRRIRNRYHHQVNGYFLCDRGRFGYEFVNGPERVRAPMVRKHEDTTPVTMTGAEVRQRLAELCGPPSRVVGIGSPRASLESNFALQTLVGTERFCMGVSERERRLLLLAHALLRDGASRAASIRDVEGADAALVLGEDVPDVAPRLALALRQLVRQAPMKVPDELGIPRWNDAAVREAIQHERGPLFVAATTDTRLDDIATASYRAAPDELARLGFAIAQALDPAAPEVDVGDGVRALAGRIGVALLAAARPIIIAGTSTGSEPLLQAAANIARALAARGRDARLALVLPECNSLGSAMLGGASLEAALEILRRGEADTLVILENDLFRRIDERTAQALLGAARSVVVIDHVLTQTARYADVLLPAATFAEASGTLVSSEGRAQRFFDTFVPAGDVRAAWRWIADILGAGGCEPVWTNLDELLAALARARPEMARVVDAAPSARFRMTGQRVARKPHRYSGRTAMRAQWTIHEPPPPADSDGPLAHSMEGSACQPPASLLPFVWSPGWNSIQALNRFQEEVGGPLRGGEAGVRLLEANGTLGYFGEAPPPFKSRPGQWLVVPSYHVFGSEELSALSPGVAARTAAPCIALHPDDAGTLGLSGESRVVVVLTEGTWTVELRVSPAIPHGVAALSVGLPRLRFAALPAWGTLEPGPRGEV
jgi:NADH-quinone oxidoreductase subunit G